MSNVTVNITLYVNVNAAEIKASSHKIDMHNRQQNLSWETLSRKKTQQPFTMKNTQYRYKYIMTMNIEEPKYLSFHVAAVVSSSSTLAPPQLVTGVLSSCHMKPSHHLARN